MKRKELETELSSCTYPGRGIILGRSADNRSAVIAYFIMGRSANSRNRIFISTADGIQTKAYDESKMVDPSLIIYAPVRQIGDETIVTNGDQTDTIYDFMKRGCSFEEALLTRTFEPDAPNFTPRISGLVKSNGDFQLSILKVTMEMLHARFVIFTGMRTRKQGRAVTSTLIWEMVTHCRVSMVNQHRSRFLTIWKLLPIWCGII